MTRTERRSTVRIRYRGLFGCETLRIEKDGGFDSVATTVRRLRTESVSQPVRISVIRIEDSLECEKHQKTVRKWIEPNLCAFDSSRRLLRLLSKLRSLITPFDRMFSRSDADTGSKL